MRITGLLPLAGALLAVSSLAAQEPAKPEKPKEPPKPSVDFAKFKFMEGCWQGETGKDQTVEEIWTSPAENLLLSTTRYYTKKRVKAYDFNRIEWVDSTVVFGILSKGKRAEDVYTLKTLADEYFVFENPTKKDFPQRIIYRLASDGALIPRNEGDAPSFELRFHRIKCPGAEHKIKE
jgi:uncharacterized protein DUF6265